ncbi:class I SAM-dependent methyltransferase [Curtobacterium ammoniigenes]|uniref:class I SAM-dependent methyltransferase n=1 Tax=Curtobacterium ammoniigenes TaxID=395387 RepID=UPI001FE1399A|nr:class I SAM-dependent methyltransferase [Curtobacterium ammoniigenes]
MRGAYDAVADTYADHFRGTEPELPIDIAMIASFASLVPVPKRTIDAGCGAGRMLPVLARLGCDVEGFDLSPEMVRRARRDHPEFPTRVGSITAFPNEDASVDGVFCWYSTIHTPDAELATAFREAHRVLAPNGVLLIALQTGTGVVDVSSSYKRFGHQIELHRYKRSPAFMGDVLVTAGFALESEFSRRAAEHERDGQAILIARRAS